MARALLIGNCQGVACLPRGRQNLSQQVSCCAGMSDSTKRARVRQPVVPLAQPLSSAQQREALQAREAGKTVMYQVDAWGHVETRFVRTQNVAAWQAKGFFVR